MKLELDWVSQNRLLTRLFDREDQFLGAEKILGIYDEDAPLSPRMQRINNMIIRVVDMKLGRSVAWRH